MKLFRKQTTIVILIFVYFFKKYNNVNEKLYLNILTLKSQTH